MGTSPARGPRRTHALLACWIGPYFLVVAVLVALTGCGADATAERTETTTQPTVAAVQQVQDGNPLDAILFADDGLGNGVLAVQLSATGATSVFVSPDRAGRDAAASIEAADANITIVQALLSGLAVPNAVRCPSGESGEGRLELHRSLSITPFQLIARQGVELGVGVTIENSTDVTIETNLIVDGVAHLGPIENRPLAGQFFDHDDIGITLTAPPRGTDQLFLTVSTIPCGDPEAQHSIAGSHALSIPIGLVDLDPRSIPASPGFFQFPLGSVTVTKQIYGGG